MYLSVTPTSTPSSFPAPKATQQPKLPTPTPFIYIIQEGDTLSGIAWRYNTSVDKLVTSNPDVNSNFLVIGEEIIIPTGDEESLTHLPIATPLPVSLSQPHCLPANQGGLWCFIEASNSLDVSLENISAVVNVYTIEGELAVSEVAIPSLNVLHPEEKIPLAAFFSPPLPSTFQVSAALLTSLSASEQMAQTSITNQDITYSSNHQQATLTGTISLLVESLPVQQIWIVGIAYDADKNMIGSRKLMIDTELAPGQSLSFTITVFSLGPPIDHVQLLSEAHE